MEPWQNGGVTLSKMTSRRQPRRNRIIWAPLAASFLVASSLALGGCSLLPGDGEPVDTATSAAPAPAPSEGAALETKAPPKSAAEELADKVDDSLKKLAGTTKAPNREQLLKAMLDAGAVKEKTELSVDITPTGLAVDAIEAAVLVADECVVGQVRDGHVAVTVLPVLDTGRCFVGDVH